MTDDYVKEKDCADEEEIFGMGLAILIFAAFAVGIVTALGLWTHVLAAFFGAWLHKRFRDR